MALGCQKFVQINLNSNTFLFRIDLDQDMTQFLIAIVTSYLLLITPQFDRDLIGSSEL